MFDRTTKMKIETIHGYDMLVPEEGFPVRTREEHMERSRRLAAAMDYSDAAFLRAFAPECLDELATRDTDEQV